MKRILKLEMNLLSNMHKVEKLNFFNLFQRNVIKLNIILDQVHLLNLNYIDDMEMKEAIKENLKNYLVSKYETVLVKELEKNCNFKVIIHQEEFKNFIGIL